MAHTIARASHRCTARVSPIAAVFILTSAGGGELSAQTSTTSPFRLETFGARNEARSAATFGGLSLSGYSGIFGLRLNGAVAGLDLDGNDRVATVPVRRCSPRSGCWIQNERQFSSGSLFDTDAWTADADLIAEPFRKVPVIRQLLLGFSPYAFAGIGRFNTSAFTGIGRDTTRAVWSYGVGAHHDLVGRLGLSGEARVRRNFDDNTFVGASFRDAVQFRVGLSVGLGGGRTRRSRDASTVRITRRGIVSAEPEIRRVPVATPATVAEAPERDASIAALVVDAAEGLLELPWREGGTTPTTGFDAGGFVQYVFAQQRIRLPRRVQELAVTGTSVPARIGTLRSGDLLFFSNDGGTPNHVAIYVGRDRFVHASASGGGVLYDVFGEGSRGNWFAEHLHSVRRVIGATTEPMARPAVPTLSPSGRPDGAPKPAGER